MPSPLAGNVDLNGADPGLDYSGAYGEGDAGAAIGASIAVTSTVPITSATISITDALAGDELILAGALPATITVLGGLGSATLTLAGTGTEADWAAALSQVRYASTSDNPDVFGSDAERTISVIVSDGAADSDPAFASIAIGAVDDDPIVGNFNGDTVTYVEGDTYALLDQNLPATIVDPDNQDFAGGSFSVGVQVNPSAQDEFFVLNLGPVATIGSDVYVEGGLIGTISSSGPGQILTIDFNGDATPALVAELIDFIAYRNLAGDNPTGGERSITYLLTDGDGGAAAGIVTVAVQPVNDAPVALDDVLAATEDTQATYAAANLIGNDSDGDLDTLAIASVSNATGGTVTLNGNGTVTFTPTANFNGVAGFDYVVSDGHGGTDNGHATVNVAAVNDAPVVTNLDGDITTFVEGGGFAGLDTGQSAAVFDIDTAFFNGGTLRVSITSGGAPGEDVLSFVNVPGFNRNIFVDTIYVTNGTRDIGNVVGGISGGGGTNGQDLVFAWRNDIGQGGDLGPSQNDLARGLGTLIYTNTNTVNPSTAPRVITITITDGAGGTTTLTTTVNVVAVDDAPSGADKTISIDEDASYVLSRADFGFSDSDGNGFAAVSLSSVPGGRLFLDADGPGGAAPAALVAGNSVTVAQLDAGLVTYVPAANANGAGLDSVTFRVRDDGGTANGGVDTDPVANTLTFDVNAVNDAPTATTALGAVSPPLTAEIQVNTATAGEQEWPAIRALHNGNLLMLWQDQNGDGSGYGIKARIFSPSGAAVTAELPVNVETALNQTTPYAAVLSSGRFVAVWSSQSGDGSEEGIKARLFEADGSPVGGEFLVNTQTVGSQSLPRVAALGDGFVAIWGDNGTNSGDTKAQVFDADGNKLGAEITVPLSTAGAQTWADIAALSSDRFVVTWTDSPSGDIKAQIFEADGDRVGGEITIALPGTQSTSHVATLAGGGFVLAWEDDSADGSGYGVKAAIFDAVGNPVGSPFLVNTTTGGHQLGTSVVALPSGGFAIAWGDLSSGNSDVKAQYFDSLGGKIGAEIALNTATGFNQFDQALAPIGNGGFAAVWTDQSGVGGDASGAGIKLRLFDAAAHAVEQVARSLKGAMSVGDVDAGSSALTVTISAGYGIITATTGDSGVTITAGNGTGALVVTGTLAALNSFLGVASTSTLAYTANTDTPPASTILAISVDDGGATGHGGGLTGGASQTILIEAVHDLPVAIDDVLAATEDVPVTYAAADLLGNDTSEGDTPTIAGVSNATGGTATLNGNGTVTFTPTANFNGVAGFDYLVSDGYGGTDTGHATVNVAAVNDAPVLTDTVVVLGAGQNEDSPAPSGAVGALVSSLVDLNPPSGGHDNVADPDGALTGIALTAVDTSHGSLFFSTDNGASWTAVDTVADGHALLLAADASTRVYFQPAANFNGTLASAITFRAWDQSSGTAGAYADASSNGGATAFSSATDTASLTINPRNDSPTVSASSPLTTDEQVPVRVNPSLVISDVDLDAYNGGAGDYAGATFLINRSTGANAQDHFSFDTTGALFTISGPNLLAGGQVFATMTSGTGSLNILFSSGNTIATTALVNDVVRHLVYTNSSDTPPASINLAYGLTDGSPGHGQGSGAPSLSTQIVTVTINPVNDAPALSGLDGTPTFTEGGAAVVLDGDATIADPELTGGNYAGATLTLARSGGASADDLFGGNGGAGLTLSGGDAIVNGTNIGTYAQVGGTLTILFNGSATQALVNGALQGITYSNGSENPPVSAEISYAFSDGNSGSQGSGGAATASGSVIVSINPVNDAPTLDGFGPSVTFTENTVNASPQLLDADVNFNDFEGNFDGGMLILSGLLSEDRAGIRNEGNGPGEIGVSGTDVSYGGVVIGTVAGGTGASLSVTFSAAATSAAVDALVQNLTFADVSDTPIANRTLQLDIFDAEGAHIIPHFEALTGVANPFDAVFGALDSTPTFVDLDNDGLADVVMGSFAGILRVYHNNGNGTFTQRTGANNPLSGVTGDYLAPAFADIDGDGRLDAVVGTKDGTLRAFHKNANGSFSELGGSANPFDGVRVDHNGTPSYFAKPSFVDLDGDGRLDAVVGENYGTLLAFHNNGNGTFTRLTGTANPFNGVDVGYRSAPSFVDLDGDGLLDVAIGASDGTIRAFHNNGNGTFTQLTGAANPFNGIDVGSRAAPTFGDLDGDGIPDALVGDAAGALHAFHNNFPATLAIAVTVTAQNDAPVIANLAGDNFTQTEDDFTTHFLDVWRDAVVTDVDSANFGGGKLTVTFTSAWNGTDTLNIIGDAHLDYDGSGNVIVDGVTIGTISGGSSGFGSSPSDTLVISFNANATPDLVQTLIHGIYVGDQRIEPVGGMRTLSLTLDDGAGGSSSYSTSFAVHSINDEPHGTDGTVSLTEDTPFTIHAADFGFDDTATLGAHEGDDLAAVFINTLPATGILYLDPDGAGTGALGTAVTMGQRIALADLDAGRLVYVPDADANGPVTLTFQVEDDNATNGSTGRDTDESPNTLTLDIAAANDDPVIGNLDTDSATFTEGNAFVRLDANPAATVSDIDSTDFDGGKLIVSFGASGLAQDRFDIAHGDARVSRTPGSVMVDGITIASVDSEGPNQDFVLSFNASATPDRVAALLHAIAYFNSAGNDPAAGTRDVTVTLTDGDGGTNSVTSHVEVTPVNDAPTAAATNTITTDEDTASAAVAIGATDPEGDTLTYSVNASGQPAHGSVAFDQVAGTFSYTPAADANGSDAFVIVIDDGHGGIRQQSVTVTINPIDDPAVAVDDGGNATDENAALSIAVLANDSDVDGPAPSVAMVDGQAIAVGGSVILGSGAKVTLEADGTLTYDPNGKFDTLTSTSSGETGAVNTSAPDSFTYTLGGTGGGTATVSVTVNGVVSAQDHLGGDGGDNIVTGTGGGDYFDLSQSGDDHASGLAGNDAYYFGAAYSQDDVVIDSGGNNDQIGLQGDYSGGVTLGTIAGIEAIVVLPGFSYDIVTVDANVAAGGVLKVQATQLAAGQSLTFDGSAETDGSFMIYGGQGDDYFTGGAGNDGFYFGPGGFNGSDIVNGGAGTNDQLALDGDYTITLGGNVTNVEVLVLLHGPSATPNHFDITSGDAFVAAGQTMTIFGLQVETDITFDGSGELDGAFKIYGGTGDDVLTGGSGADWLFGGDGADTLTGGAGNDVFYYDAVSQSTPAGRDGIQDFTTGDKIDLSGIDAMNGGGNDAFTFIGSGAFTGHAGELQAINTSGSNWTVSGDTNGDGVADFQLVVVVADAHPLAGTDFTF